MESIIPRDESHWLELRSKDITSTEVAALFGLSPYATAFELYHRQVNKEFVEEFEGNEFTKWGNRLESAIAHGIAEDQGWKIRPMKEYCRLPDKRLGASFDFAILDEVALGVTVDKALLEIKNVFGFIFHDQWKCEDDTIEAPPHIELQVQTQLAVRGLPVAYIGALIDGNKLQLLKRKPDKDIINKIYAKVADFWHHVDNKIEPDPDFVKDAEFIAKLYGYAEPDKLLDARGKEPLTELASKYKSASVRERAAKDDKKNYKSQILMMIDDHEKVIGDGYKISAGMIAPTSIEASERKGYRNFRVNWSKKK